MPVNKDASGVGLLLAARSGDVEIVRSLVRQGAELEQRDILGDNGLLKAARYGHAQVHMLRIHLASLCLVIVRQRGLIPSATQSALKMQASGTLSAQNKDGG